MSWATNRGPSRAIVMTAAIGQHEHEGGADAASCRWQSTCIARRGEAVDRPVRHSSGNAKASGLARRAERGGHRDRHKAGVTGLDENGGTVGLGVLIAALKRVRTLDGSMPLVITSQLIVKTFRITGLVKVFEIHPSLLEAMSAAD
jgi:hypothetical protein